MTNPFKLPSLPTMSDKDAKMFRIRKAKSGMFFNAYDVKFADQKKAKRFNVFKFKLF